MHSADRAEPNLVPILDMVFQLITFFMLVINFKAAETDASIKLPVVGSARPVETKGQGELLVLNLNDGKLMVRGKEEPSIDKFIKEEVVVLTAQNQNLNKNDLPITVVVRADREVQVQFLMRVVRACQANGCRKFDFMVMRAAKEGGGS
jgi:biopolymer transport protein ExbD